MNLVRYEAACRALTECKAVDEVKRGRTRPLPSGVWPDGKGKTLEVDAAEIRIRAERLGELIAAQKATVGLNTGAAGIGKSALPARRALKPDSPDMGISHNLSSRSQLLAAVSEAEFESELGKSGATV